MSVQNRVEAGERRTHGLMAKIELVRISICGAVKTSNKLRAASEGKSDAQPAAAMPWLSWRGATAPRKSRIRSRATTAMLGDGDQEERRYERQ